MATIAGMEEAEMTTCPRDHKANIDYSKCRVCDLPTPDKSGLCEQHYKALISPQYPKNEKAANMKIAKLRALEEQK